jgi:hypothetical protein
VQDPQSGEKGFETRGATMDIREIFVSVDLAPITLSAAHARKLAEGLNEAVPAP